MREFKVYITYPTAHTKKKKRFQIAIICVDSRIKCLAYSRVISVCFAQEHIVNSMCWCVCLCCIFYSTFAESSHRTQLSSANGLNLFTGKVAKKGSIQKCCVYENQQKIVSHTKCVGIFSFFRLSVLLLLLVLVGHNLLLFSGFFFLHLRCRQLRSCQSGLVTLVFTLHK